jgi:hypothetical protein
VTWRKNVDLAASFAAQAADAARDEGDESAERVFDHLAYVMENTAGLADLYERN